MFCVPISDDMYRRAAKIAGIADVFLAPVDDPGIDALRVRVDAVLLRALKDGLSACEEEEVSFET